MPKIIIYVLLILLGGGWIYLRISKYLRCSESVLGTIIGTDRRRIRSRSRTRYEYCPIVEFTANGVLTQATADSGSVFEGKYKTGENVDIKYNPSDPQEIVLKGKGLLPVLAGGLLLIALGVLGLYYTLI